MKKTLISHNPEETFEIGRSLAPLVWAGSVITLAGDLGAGKTTLTSGVAAGIGVTEHVISPTFNIMRMYMHGRLPLFHIDAYRLEDGNADIGLEEFVDDGGVALIEWPQYVRGLIPANALAIRLTNVGPTTRLIECETDDVRWQPFFATSEENHP